MIEWNVHTPKIIEDQALGAVVTEVGFSVYDRLDDQIVQGEFGVVQLSAPNPSSFTPMTNLSKDVVIEWVKQALGADVVKEIESKLSDLVAERTTPVVVSAQPEASNFSW